MNCAACGKEQKEVFPDLKHGVNFQYQNCLHFKVDGGFGMLIDNLDLHGYLAEFILCAKCSNIVLSMTHQTELQKQIPLALL